MYSSKPSGITTEINVFRDKVQQNYKVHSLHLLRKMRRRFTAVQNMLQAKAAILQITTEPSCKIQGGDAMLTELHMCTVNR